jgi:transposase
MARWEATPIVLSAEERGTLEAWARATSIERRRVERARIVLLAAEGLASRAIGRELGCRHHTVSKWRVRFARDRLAGLADAPRSGKPKTYDATADRRILIRAFTNYFQLINLAEDNERIRRLQHREHHDPDVPRRGSIRTPMTYDFLEEWLQKAEFTRVNRCGYQETESRYPEIVELDNREAESLFVEAIK